MGVFTDKGFRSAVNTLALPVTAAPTREIVALVKAWAAGQTVLPAAGQASGYPATRLIDQELGGIIDALYGFIEGTGRCSN